jgi:RNA polymerase sigma-70 factor (ECF subfamily)
VTVSPLAVLASTAYDEAADPRPTRGEAIPRQAFDLEDLYRRYGDLVVGRCRSLLGNDADAREAAQEIFLRLWRYRHGFRGEASPATYLFKVTTTTCLNRLRSRRRRPEDPVEELPPSAAVTDTMLASIEVRQLLRLLLEDEDERTQAAVVYHFVDGMTHEEAGELLGLSGAAIRKRIAQFRARVAGGPLAWLREARR